MSEARETALLPVEISIGVVIALLLWLLPLTAAAYIVGAAIVLPFAAHMGWHYAGRLSARRIWKFSGAAIGLSLCGPALAWGWSVKFPVLAPTKPESAVKAGTHASPPIAANAPTAPAPPIKPAPKRAPRPPNAAPETAAKVSAPAPVATPQITLAFPLTAPPPVPTPSNPYAKISNPNIVLVPKDQSDPKTQYYIRVSIENKGTASAIGLRHNYAARLSTKELSDVEIDNLATFSKEHVTQGPAQDPEADEIEPGTPDLYHQVSVLLNASDYAALKAGKTYLYVIDFETYADKYLPQGQYWVTEFCGYKTSDVSATYFCDKYNNTRIHK